MGQVKLRRDQDFNLIQDSYGWKAFRGEYDVNNNLIYAAFAIEGADESERVWQLKKLEYSGTNLISIIWPEIDGKASSAYSFAWVDRLTYTYS